MKTNSWTIFAAGALALLSTVARAEDVTCKDAGGVSYKLSFNWQTDKADIAVKSGSGWKNLYKGATAVRNSAADKAFLAEGTAKEWVGPANNDAGCGKFVEVLYFDVAVQNGKRVGTVERTPKWTGTEGGNCKAKAAAPDLSGSVTAITCT